MFLSHSYLNTKNISVLFPLITNLLAQSLKPFEDMNAANQTDQPDDPSAQTLHFITPSNVQPVILFLGQFMKFWKTHSVDLRRICFLLRKVLNVLALQLPNPLEDSAMRNVVDQILIIMLRLLDYVWKRLPLVQRMEEASESPAQYGNPFQKDDPSRRNAVWYEGQCLIRENSVFEVGDELVTEKSSQLIVLMLSNCQLLNLVTSLAARYEKDTMTEETLLRISNCMLITFRIVKQYRQPSVPTLKSHSKVGALVDDALKEVAASLQNFPCNQMTFLLNRITPEYIDLLLENRSLESLLLFFRKSLAQTLILYFVFEEVSNRLNVAIESGCDVDVDGGRSESGVIDPLNRGGVFLPHCKETRRPVHVLHSRSPLYRCNYL